MKIKSLPIGQVKTGPEDGLEEGEFIVYPSTFTREPDSYGDVVAKGAFADTLKEWKESGNVLPGLYGHRFDDPDYYVAAAEDYGEDEHGWWVKGKFNLDSPKGPQTYDLVKKRMLTQLSFAFDVLDQSPIELEDGRKANELRKLRVHEFSFVPVGANQDTSVVAVKALAESLKAGRALSTKNEDQLRQAQSLIEDVLSSIDQSEEKTDDPQVSGDEPDMPDQLDADRVQAKTGGQPALALANIEMIALEGAL